MSKRSIRDFFNVIQEEKSGPNDEEGKPLDLIAWPCRQAYIQKYCMWWFYRKFLKQWRHPFKIFFPEESSTSQFRQNDLLYPESFTESGQVKVLIESEKVALLEGRWDSADLFAYSFHLRFEYKFWMKAYCSTICHGMNSSMKTDIFRNIFRKSRKINPDIIARTLWLRYSPTTDTLYCCYCLLFITHDRSFRTRDWSNISKLVKKHVCEKSAHHTAVARGPNICQQLQSQRAEQVRRNRIILKCITEVLVMMGKQNMAIRGQQDEDSNFMAMLSLLAKENSVLTWLYCWWVDWCYK